MGSAVLAAPAAVARAAFAYLSGLIVAVGGFAALVGRLAAAEQSETRLQPDRAAAWTLTGEFPGDLPRRQPGRG